MCNGSGIEYGYDFANDLYNQLKIGISIYYNTHIQNNAELICSTFIIKQYFDVYGNNIFILIQPSKTGIFAAEL